MSRSLSRNLPMGRQVFPGLALSLAVALLLLSAPPALAQLAPGGVYAVQGARLVTAPGRVIQQGTIVVRGGLIEAVGQDVQPPPDAVVVDGRGLTVYPGFIDAFSQAGLALPSGQDREPAANIAHRASSEWFDPHDQGLDAWRRRAFDRRPDADYLCACLGKREGNGATDAPACPGDEGCLTAEVGHRNPDGFSGAIILGLRSASCGDLR